MTNRLHFNVIANSREHVSELLQSAEISGFSVDMFTIFWNDVDNVHEPYSTINEVLESSNSEFEILCHQDVRFLATFGPNELLGMLDSIPQEVSVTGIAGVSLDCRWYCCVQDETKWPEGDVTFTEPKIGVTHIDECFICFSTRCPTFASNLLSGFHCYGTDVTLNALYKGYKTSLIPFQIRHLSKGNFGDDFHRSLGLFVDYWGRRALGFTHREGYCVIAPKGWIRRLLGRKRVQRIAISVLGKSILFYPKLLVR